MLTKGIPFLLEFLVGPTAKLSGVEVSTVEGMGSLKMVEIADGEDFVETLSEDRVRFRAC